MMIKEILEKHYTYKIEWFDSIEKVDAQFIKDLRERLDLTQKHFATIVGIPQRKIAKWEKGRKIPQPMKLLFYAINQDNNIIEYVYKITYNKKGELWEKV